MLRRFRDLILVYAVAVLAILVAASPAPWKALVAVPLVLFTPGYALVKALFLDREVKLPERLLFSVGLSIAITILGGMLLNLTSWGLQRFSVSLLLALVTMVASLIAILRRVFQPRAIRHPTRLKFDSTSLALLVLASFLVFLSIGLAHLPAPAKGFQGYTLLWILPAGNGQEGYRVGLENDEFSMMIYQLQIEAGGEQIMEIPSLSVDRGQRWERLIEIPPEHQGQYPITARLYRADSPQDVYRTVRYWP